MIDVVKNIKNLVKEDINQVRVDDSSVDFLVGDFTQSVPVPYCTRYQQYLVQVPGSVPGTGTDMVPGTSREDLTNAAALRPIRRGACLTDDVSQFGTRSVESCRLSADDGSYCSR
jgi:hypothetical protein